MSMAGKAARALFWTCCAAIVLLTFAWPYAVSPDPANVLFKPVAIATFCTFCAALVVLLGQRLQER